MMTFEKFKKHPELYGAAQIVQQDVLVYPAYVEYVERASRQDLLKTLHDFCLDFDNADIKQMHGIREFNMAMTIRQETRRQAKQEALQELYDAMTEQDLLEKEDLEGWAAEKGLELKKDE